MKRGPKRHELVKNQIREKQIEKRKNPPFCHILAVVWNFDLFSQNLQILNQIRNFYQKGFKSQPKFFMGVCLFQSIDQSKVSASSSKRNWNGQLESKVSAKAQVLVILWDPTTKEFVDI